MKETGKAIALFTQIAVSMLVPIFICLIIGRWLDGIFNTGGILLILFIVLGIGAGFRSIYYMVRSFWKDKDSYIDMNDIKEKLKNSDTNKDDENE